jgi:monoamine oxidase
MNKQKLIIVGGGISGLIAARHLCLQYEVIILEALSRLGGRINTINDEQSGIIIEAGAEFVHGEAGETIKLLKEAGIEFIKVEGEFYQKNDKGLRVQEYADNGWEGMLKKMAAEEQDMTLREFLDTHYSEPEFHELCRRALTFAKGFDLADPDRVSMRSLYEEWSHQSDDHRIKGGYALLIGYLMAECQKKGCRLVTNAEVKEIRWNDSQVQLLTTDESSYTADKCLLTVPLGVLQKRKLNFIPAIDPYLEAADQIGFGTVIKVILTFNERFWNADAGFFLSEESIPTWWTQLPEQTPVLTGWAAATELNDCSGEQILEKALDSLSAIFDLSRPLLKEKLRTWRIFNWQQQETIQGAYSFNTPESKEALKILNTPVRNRIYFAGEALYSGIHPGTVEAAIISAQQVAGQLTDHAG